MNFCGSALATARTQPRFQKNLRERKKLAFSSFVSYVQFYAENLEMEGKPENAA
jgi:hypothetical protein